MKRRELHDHLCGLTRFAGLHRGHSLHETQGQNALLRERNDPAPTWLARTRPAILHATIATAGIYLMRAALTLTPPVDLTGMDGLVGSAGAALLGIATALTASQNRTIRTITAPGLAIGYAIVFTNNTNSALIVGYLVALTWWGIQLTAHTLRIAFPTTGQALRRLIDGQAT